MQLLCCKDQCNNCVFCLDGYFLQENYGFNYVESPESGACKVIHFVSNEKKNIILYYMTANDLFCYCEYTDRIR